MCWSIFISDTSIYSWNRILVKIQINQSYLYDFWLLKKRWNVKQNSLSSVACKVKNSSDFWFIINQIVFFKYTTYIFYRSIRISFACKRFPFFNIRIVPATAFTSNSYKESWEVWVHDLTLELLSVVQVHFHWRKNCAPLLSYRKTLYK